ncbi:MAG: ABC transporter [Acidobacteria bacterium]|nr:MAG: ABC transporter [Acidobacteriota bacterium]PYY01998.1 MAG: ABC transporter [Acidobacteriota bacterium]PYY24787.1 MAG: ABC transporter [Acidobacteriota bacterium]
MKNSSLQQHVINLLNFEGAHVGFDQSVRGLGAELRGKKIKGFPHTAWQLLEHMRIAQWDILEFSRNSKHVSPKWPDGYWPQSSAPADEEAWKKSIAAFRRDLEEVKKLVSQGDEQQLCARIPHGDGQTLLREALLVADHNSYHLGQLVMLRKMFGAWK